MNEVTIRPLAESALLVVLGERIDPAVNAQALGLASAVTAAAIPGVTDAVPAYATVLIAFDPEVTEGSSVASALRELLARGVASAAGSERLREIPVVYDGPDLEEVAAGAGLKPNEVAQRHAAATYRVAYLGFSPGFGYLIGLPPELATPRRATPRTRVPRGTVAIGGAQTGVYAQDTPGGWNMIGRTSMRMFDLDRAEASYLQPGDSVRFVAVDRLPEADSSARSAIERDDIGAHVEVVQPGGMTTVQDLGRLGLMHLGVTPGGALDRRAAVLANRLVGNDPGAAVIEGTAVGPTLWFSGSTVIAVTGAAFGPELDGVPIPMWEPVLVEAGSTLRFAQAARPGRGWRCMIAIAGGVQTAAVLGSRSTDTFGNVGGLDGGPLRSGDRLPIAVVGGDVSRRMRLRLTGAIPRVSSASPMRIVLGPQDGWFSDEGIAALVSSPYAVTTRSDRMGLRLSGSAIERSTTADMLSEGIAAGAIQVPPDGQPIVLLPPRQTVGGYPKIATVIGADLDRLGQLAPGDVIRFAVVSSEEALDVTRRYRASYGDDAVGEQDVHVVSGARLRGSGAGWDAEAVKRMLDDAEAGQLHEVDVRLPGGGMRLTNR